MPLANGKCQKRCWKQQGIQVSIAIQRNKHRVICLALLSCVAKAASHGLFFGFGAQGNLDDRWIGFTNIYVEEFKTGPDGHDISKLDASRGLGPRHSLLEVAGPKIFDVTTFGAKGDDKTDNTPAFMDAWVAACRNTTTAAKVLIPEGNFLLVQTMFSGPCNSTKPIIFEVLGTVTATTDLSEFPSPEWLLFADIDSLVLKGKGVFDGQGAGAWLINDCHQNEDCQTPPASLKLHRVNNSIVTGITSLNSKWFHLLMDESNNLTVTDIKITAPGNSPNTDGVHISGSNLVNVTNTVIGTGGDCVSIGQGSSNITVHNVTCGPGHGISVGSLGKRTNEKSVEGVTVTECSFINTTNGARIQTWRKNNTGEAKNIVFENLIMNNVQNPVVINQSYGFANNLGPSDSAWKISDAHFRKIIGSTVSNIAISLQCSALNPCQGIEVADVDLVYSGPPENTIFVSSCSNANATFGGKLNPPACAV
ncbi:hypothetical protein L6164_034722 [Bauhinia variegata]|uniref:Uncharacterized protein n=1 Tax=Bauhinia variegata TaxID=167791 RepID=A0ACB9KVI3_BAUVA|nr:hypothetical protein L6164_034722 [Bauhinia variegata]